MENRRPLPDSDSLGEVTVLGVAQLLVGVLCLGAHLPVTSQVTCPTRSKSPLEFGSQRTWLPLLLTLNIDFICCAEVGSTITAD